jgi:hypothetical protein
MNKLSNGLTVLAVGIGIGYTARLVSEYIEEQTTIKKLEREAKEDEKNDILDAIAELDDYIVNADMLPLSVPNDCILELKKYYRFMNCFLCPLVFNWYDETEKTCYFSREDFGDHIPGGLTFSLDKYTVKVQ